MRDRTVPVWVRILTGILLGCMVCGTVLAAECSDGCSCMTEDEAEELYGVSSIRCSDDICGYDTSIRGITIPEYCFSGRVTLSTSTVMFTVAPTATATPTLIRVATTATPMPTAVPVGEEVAVIVSPSSPGPADVVTVSAAYVRQVEVPYIAIYVNGGKVKECYESRCEYTGGPYPDGLSYSVGFTTADGTSYFHPAMTAIETPKYLPEFPDSDNDGVFDYQDNCPMRPNPHQNDSEKTPYCQMVNIGDYVCIPVASPDGVGDVCDNCKYDENPGQEDADGDGDGDVCDNCPQTANPDQADADGDGLGDVCDAYPGASDLQDYDHDTVPDAVDNCPQSANADQKDTNKDGEGDACDCDDSITGPYETSDGCGGPCGPCNPNVCTDAVLPKVFDYRDWMGKNWMTPVRDQAMCGSCYAHGPLAAVEAKYNLEMNQLFNLDLAEQQYVSPCFGGVGSCLGGNMVAVLSHLKTDGAAEEICFPYTSDNCVHTVPAPKNLECNFAGHCSDPQTCDVCAWKSIRWVIGKYAYAGGTGEQVKRNIACHGPLVVGSDTWWHVVVMVGWDDWHNAWIVKNSWGTGWESDGYGYIGYDSQIGKELALSAYYVEDVGFK